MAKALSTVFQPGTALRAGDVVHPAEGEPVTVTDVTLAPSGEHAVVRFASGLVAELTTDDVVEIEARTP